MPRRDTLTRRTGGRPTSLTPHTADTIIRTIREGNHASTACALAGINQATFYRWMQRAEAAEYALEHGKPYDHADDIYREFRKGVLRARARAAEVMVDVVHRAAVGGELVSEEPALDGSGNPIRDEDGRVVMKRVWSQPDGRLALSYLKVAQPAEWGGGPSRLELSGPGGGPVETSGSVEPEADAVGRLASRLALTMKARADEEAEAAAAAEGDVVDGEVVDE